MSDTELLKLDLKVLIKQAERHGACDSSIRQLNCYKDMEELLQHAPGVYKAYWCYWYARCVLKGPFPAGEEAIATDADYSHWYEKYVLRAPLPLGERLARAFLLATTTKTS